ncbi:Myb-like domain-containing protein [Plasmodiophora brassicae]|uniref:Myb-like domain-containing protein n=1 Tax=Plasmodiophora brassicae TaxID=37360 RepID=A0A0G4IT26_PLABS|nr:hypothetical protein PBRA_006491 [Plasmodiophora brassicae]SPQ94463.1 unnamed protein product [Plasmodiophora brassicae]
MAESVVDVAAPVDAAREASPPPVEGDAAASKGKKNRKRSRMNSSSGAPRRPMATFPAVAIAPRYPFRRDMMPTKRWKLDGPNGIKHWTPLRSPGVGFARVEGKFVVERYTDDEYTRLFATDEWTREETDLLLDLTEKFDRRFIIVKDRFPPQHSKTLEQIKFRFYEIQSGLAKARSAPGTENPSAVEDFDVAYELNRKAQLELLFKRTLEGEREVARLVLEHRTIEQTIRKRKRENSEARRVVKVQKAIDKMSNAVVDGVVKRRSTRPPTEEEQKENPFSGLPDHIVIVNAFKPPHSGVYLRSAQPPTVPTIVNVRLQKQLEQELEDIGLQPNTFTTPTGLVCDMYDRLRVDYLTLFNLQRYVARKDAETSQLRADLEAAQRQAPAKPKNPPPSGSRPSVSGSGSSSRPPSSSKPPGSSRPSIPKAKASSLASQLPVVKRETADTGLIQTVPVEQVPNPDPAQAVAVPAVVSGSASQPPPGAS